MTDDVLQLLLEDAEYAALLRAYERARTETAPQADADPETAGWTPRIAALPGVDDVLLAPMHGKLIAHGLLNFQLADRTGGVVYRVSPEGRDALRRLEAVSSGEAVEEADSIESDDEFPAEAAA
jgi:hypothetical protein